MDMRKTALGGRDRSRTYPLVLLLLAAGLSGCSARQSENFTALILQMGAMIALSITSSILGVSYAMLRSRRSRATNAYVAIAFFAIAFPCAGAWILSLDPMVQRHPDGILCLFFLQPHDEMGPGWFNILLVAAHALVAASALRSGWRSTAQLTPWCSKGRGSPQNRVQPR